MTRTLTILSTLLLGATLARADSFAIGPKGSRIDRKVVRNTIDHTRIHPDGEALVKDPNVKRLELSDGSKVAFTYTAGQTPRGYRSVDVTVHGREDGKDVPLARLNAKQRVEIRGMLQPLEANFKEQNPQGYFRVDVERAPEGALKTNLAKAVSPTTREARNFLSLQEVAPASVK